MKSRYWVFVILQLCPVSLSSSVLLGGNSSSLIVVERTVTEKARVQRTRSDSK